MALGDYYILLGVSRQATADELKKAYRRLAVHWHPDRNPGSKIAEERFKAVSEAYAVLSSPHKRRQYDLLGPAEFKNEFAHEDIFQGFEPGDFFKMFGLDDAKDALTHIFDENRKMPVAKNNDDSKARISDFFAGFGQKNPPRDTKSPDILIALQLSFKEAALGADKFVAYNTPGGAVKVPVNIAPATNDRQRIIIKGKGPAQAGGQPGDIIVTVSVTPDPLFTRRGYDIQTFAEATPEDLNKGCRPLVTSLTGKPLRLSIPAGTIAGATFKVQGYGLPKPDGGNGDMLVKIKMR